MSKINQNIWLVVTFFLLSCTMSSIKWKNTQALDDIKSYEEYLLKNPNSIHANTARERIDELSFKEAQEFDTIETYKDYLSKYPEGNFINYASNRIDELSFKNAQKSDTIETYKDYLSKYPKGAFANIASNRVEELKSKNVRKNELEKISEIFVRDALAGNMCAGLAYFIDGKLPYKIPMERVLVDKENNIELIKTLLTLGRKIENIPKEELEAAGFVCGPWGNHYYRPKSDLLSNNSYYFNRLDDKCLIILPKDTVILGDKFKSLDPVILEPSLALYKYLLIDGLDNYGYVEIKGLGYVPLSKDLLLMLTDQNEDNGHIIFMPTGQVSKEGYLLCRGVVINFIEKYWPKFVNADLKYVLTNGKEIKGSQVVFGKKAISLINEMESKPPGYPETISPWAPYKLSYGDILYIVKGLETNCRYWKFFAENNEVLYFTIMSIAACRE